MKKTALFLAIILPSLLIFGCQQQLFPASVKLTEQINSITTSPGDFGALINISAFISTQSDDAKNAFANKSSAWFRAQAEALNPQDSNFSSFENLYEAQQTEPWKWVDRDTNIFNENILKNRTYQWVDLRFSKVSVNNEDLTPVRELWLFQKTDVYENYVDTEAKKMQRYALKNATLEWVLHRINKIDVSSSSAMQDIGSLSGRLEQDFMREILADQIWMEGRITNLTEQVKTKHSVILSVNITSPSNGTFIKTRTPISFSYNSSLGIRLAKIYFGNILVDTDTSPIYEWTIYPREYVPGIYNLSVQAVDNSYNNASDSVVVIIPGESCGNRRCDYEYGETCAVCQEDCRCSTECSPGKIGANSIGCLIS